MPGHAITGRVNLCVVSTIAASIVLLSNLNSASLADETPAAVAKTVDNGNPQSDTVADSSSKAQQERVQSLIHDLGDSRFSARRRAANELRQIGAEAFDALHAATEDSDPEIAASASYILRQIAVRWVQPEDSALVRAQLRQYGQEAETARIQHIEQLGRLPQNAGVIALCRIVRYDRSPLVSRMAALAIIHPKDADSTRSALDETAVTSQLGASTRPSAVWLHQFLTQQHDPAVSIPAWKHLIDEESGRLEKSGETSNEILLGLEWNLAELFRQTGNTAEVCSVLDRIVDLGNDNAEDTLMRLLKWLTKNKSWEMLNQFLDKHQAQVAQYKRPLYYAALARVAEGKHDQAEQLASDAAAASSQSRLDSYFSARDLEEHNQFDWAVREYHRAIEKQSSETGEPFLARVSLANLLHDHEQEKEAAETLEPLVKSVQGEAAIAQLYANIRNYYSGRAIDLPDADVVVARYHFYRACQYQLEKDLTRAKDEFDLAIKFNPQDADVLIAMYNFPQGDAKWHDAIRQRVRQMAQQFQQQIDEDPTDPIPYNQWAWLVSNTEGDFQRAVRYSQRSLELNNGGESGSGSYLDTLGRCYYAIGDYEKAVKYEREALTKVNYMQVMQRQLALFEKALVDKKAGAKTEPAKSN